MTKPPKLSPGAYDAMRNLLHPDAVQARHRAEAQNLAGRHKQEATAAAEALQVLASGLSAPASGPQSPKPGARVLGPASDLVIM
jgi:hypothetical protein